MVTAVSRGQALELSARIMTQTDWDSLDGESLQRDLLELGVKEFRCRVTAAIKNGLRMVPTSFKITPLPFDPTFVGENWKVIEKEVDQRSASLGEVDFVKARLTHFLRAGEPSIGGEENLKRQIDSGDIRLGAEWFMALWRDWEKNGISCLLERMFQAGMIKNWLYFFGTLFLSPNGDRRVLYIYRNSI